jgi:hypothetical protein
MLTTKKPNIIATLQRKTSTSGTNSFKLSDKFIQLKFNITEGMSNIFPYLISTSGTNMLLIPFCYSTPKARPS